MAAMDPSYFQSIPLKQEIQQKEIRFHLYMFQHYKENQETIVDARRPNDFGSTVVHDWTIRDDPSLNAKIVAHAQGLHLGAGIQESTWFICFNIDFVDERFKASSLKVFGTLMSNEDGEWAIIGGTGEFAFAQGVITYRKIAADHVSTIRELQLRAWCLTLPKPVLVTKIGPWGGHGGIEFDITQSVSQRLESVTIRSGVVINSIAFSYVDLAGKKQTLGPWGGDGELIERIIFAPLEIVKEVSGTTGTFDGETVVKSLTFITNVRTYGPFGKPNRGIAFSVPLIDTNVVGFFVRARRFLNALGVYARPSIQS